jgi:twitching motility protein PilT
VHPGTATQKSKGAAPTVSLRFDEVSDWYLPESEEGDFLVYPGGVRPAGELLAHAHKLRENVLWRQGQENEQLRDWRLEYKGLTYRVHRQRTVEGAMYMLRRLATQLPELKDVGLPADVFRFVASQHLGDYGGLIVVSGGPGHGKSTTCAAILLERVSAFGHFCLTVEDPPEFGLHGLHESRNGNVGQIVQVPAASDSFAADLKDALRCYPSNMRGSMLMVGEVRDGDTAAQLLRSAVNGQLVFCTLHASDPIGALERLQSLAKTIMGPEEASSLLAHSLRAVLQQTILNKRLHLESLISMGPTSSVAARIKAGNLAQLSTDVQQQATWLRNGRLLELLISGGLTTTGASNGQAANPRR